MGRGHLGGRARGRRAAARADGRHGRAAQRGLAHLPHRGLRRGQRPALPIPLAQRWCCTARSGAREHRRQGSAGRGRAELRAVRSCDRCLARVERPPAALFVRRLWLRRSAGARRTARKERARARGSWRRSSRRSSNSLCAPQPQRSRPSTRRAARCGPCAQTLPRPPRGVSILFERRIFERRIFSTRTGRRTNIDDQSARRLTRGARSLGRRLIRLRASASCRGSSGATVAPHSRHPLQTRPAAAVPDWKTPVFVRKRKLLSPIRRVCVLRGDRACAGQCRRGW